MRIKGNILPSNHLAGQGGMAIEQERTPPYPQAVRMVSSTVNMDHDGVQGLEGRLGLKRGQYLR